VPDGTHITTADDGTLESFERAVLGALLWRRPEAAEMNLIPTAGLTTQSTPPSHRYDFNCQPSYLW
jgi:hypothetical protein